MSYSFTVPCPVPPRYEDLLDSLGLDDLCTDAQEEHPQENVPWPEGVLHFYCDHVSTRGCEVSYENEQFGVRINTLASPQDYDLALRFTEQAARLSGQLIHSEDEQYIEPDQLRAIHGEGWIEETNQYGLQSVVKMLREDDDLQGPLTLPGCIRPFHIGKRVLDELERAGPPEHLLTRFMKLFRKVQFADSGDRYFASEIMAFQKHGEDEEIRASVFVADVDYLVPDVPFLLMPVADEEFLRVPIEAVRSQPQVRWQWLDETQMLVERVPAEEWPALIAAVRPYNQD